MTNTTKALSMATKPYAELAAIADELYQNGKHPVTGDIYEDIGDACFDALALHSDLQEDADWKIEVMKVLSALPDENWKPLGT